MLERQPVELGLGDRAGRLAVGGVGHSHSALAIAAAASAYRLLMSLPASFLATSSLYWATLDIAWACLSSIWADELAFGDLLAFDHGDFREHARLLGGDLDLVDQRDQATGDGDRAEPATPPEVSELRPPRRGGQCDQAERILTVLLLIA